MDGAKVKPTSYDSVSAACSRLCEWHMEGRLMPGYVASFGKPYIALLLGLSNFSTVLTEGGESYTDRFFREYEAGGFTFAEDITGPNGWAMLQYYIVRTNEL